MSERWWHPRRPIRSSSASGATDYERPAASEALHDAQRVARSHDLRRTAALGMASISIPPHVIEAVLNHISGAKAGVVGTYNVYAYEPEKKAALER